MSSAASQSRRYHDWYGGERRQSWATPPAFFAPLHAEYGFTWGLTSLSTARPDGERRLAQLDRRFGAPPDSNAPTSTVLEVPASELRTGDDLFGAGLLDRVFVRRAFPQEVKVAVAGARYSFDPDETVTIRRSVA